MKRRPVTARIHREHDPVRARPTDLPEEHLGYLLKRLQHSIRQAIDERLRIAGVGLSFAHFATLIVISHHPGISGARIAKSAMVTAQTINTILRRLESEGSVERKPHPDNKRVDCWYITEVGRAQMQHARATADPVWETMLATLAESEVEQLRGLLKRCIGGLERTRATNSESCGPIAAAPRGPRPGRRATGSIRKDPVSRGK